MDVKMTIE